MKYAILAAAIIALAACNTSGLSSAPRATFSQLGCLDVNGDNRINASDASDPLSVPDFNGDRSRDDDDTAFLRDLDIPLDPIRDRSACEGTSKRQPEYLVAHGFLQSSDVSCDSDRKAVLVIGIGGGVVNLKEKDDAEGIRSIVDALLSDYDDRDVQTIGVISGQAMAGAQAPHTAMEQWVTNVARVYLDRYPCLRLVLVGHSHGAITADVTAAHLEDQYKDRMLAVVDVDRVEELYVGDLTSRPRSVYNYNIYETNDPILRGAPYDAANAENWDASGEKGPKGGEEGAKLEPVSHTTIDNSVSVRERIVERVMEREL